VGLSLLFNQLNNILFIQNMGDTHAGIKLVIFITIFVQLIIFQLGLTAHTWPVVSGLIHELLLAV